jgi:hypothetical protein
MLLIVIRLHFLETYNVALGLFKLLLDDAPAKRPRQAPGVTVRVRLWSLDGVRQTLLLAGNSIRSATGGDECTHVNARHTAHIYTHETVAVPA